MKTRRIEVKKPISENKTANQIILVAVENTEVLLLLRMIKSFQKWV